MSAIPKVTLTAGDVKRLRDGEIRPLIASDGTEVLVAVAGSPYERELTWPHTLVVTADQLDLIELDPRAGLVVHTKADTEVLFHLVGERQ